MEKIMEQVTKLYGALKKRLDEVNVRIVAVSEKEIELDGKLASVEEVIKSLESRERKVKAIEDVIALAEDAKKAIIEADVVLYNAKNVLLKSEDKERVIAVKNSALLAKEKNIESQQKSLNGEAVRLEKDRKEMKDKILANIQKGM